MSERAACHGRLASGAGAGAPTTGEESTVLARGDGFVVDQILTGSLDAPVAFDQDHDEWFVVVEGGAVIAVDEVEHALGPGDWWFLPARVPHVLVRAAPGTSWIAVRSFEPSSGS